MSGVEMSDLQNLKIRDATLEDAKELLEVHIRSIREICSNDYTDEQISAWSDPKTDESYHEPISKGCFWVGEFDGKIVGFSQIIPADNEVLAVYVHPEYLRKGIGRKLLERMELEAERLGLEFLQMDSSVTAKAFYESAG